MVATRKHRGATRAAATLVVGMIAAAFMPSAASASVISQAFSASATSTIVHADAVRALAGKLADVEVAFSGTALDSRGLRGTLENEVGETIHNPLGSKSSIAVGTAVEAGLGVATGALNQIQLMGRAISTAPNPIHDVKRLGPISLAPLAWTSLLNSTADAGYSKTCPLGRDATRGSSGVADLEALDLGGALTNGRLALPVVSIDAPNPNRMTVDSVSRTRFVAQTNPSGKVLGNLAGLMSEARATVAPITLFKGTPTELTIEVLGEWVLRAVATGKPGGAWIHYGPANASPETPVVRIIQGGVVGTVLSLQQILGNAGLNVNLPGIAEISIGEEARAIGGAYKSSPSVASDGTSASAAVDVVRVKLLPALGLADVRVGHMEVRSAVPSGGIACAIPVTKTPDKAAIPVGGSDRITIAITDPFSCDIRNLKATDAISTESFARYAVSETTSDGVYSGDAASGAINWALGSIKHGTTKRIYPVFFASDGPGKINDTVRVTGTCGVSDANGSITVPVLVTGTASASTAVTPFAVLGVKHVLADTGSHAPTFAAIGLLFLMSGVTMRRYGERYASRG